MATSLTRPLDAVPIEEALNTILKKIPNVDTLLFSTADRLFGLSSTRTVHFLNNADAYMPLTQDCLPPLVDSTTGLYNKP